MSTPTVQLSVDLTDLIVKFAKTCGMGSQEANAAATAALLYVLHSNILAGSPNDEIALERLNFIAEKLKDLRHSIVM